MSALSKIHRILKAIRSIPMCRYEKTTKTKNNHKEKQTLEATINSKAKDTQDHNNDVEALGRGPFYYDLVHINPTFHFELSDPDKKTPIFYKDL